MIRERTFKRFFRDDLFLDSKSQERVSGEVYKIAEGHYEIKGQRETHRFRDWLTDWQEKNGS